MEWMVCREDYGEEIQILSILTKEKEQRTVKTGLK